MLQVYIQILNDIHTQSMLQVHIKLNRHKMIKSLNRNLFRYYTMSQVYMKLNIYIKRTLSGTDIILCKPTLSCTSSYTKITLQI